MIYDGLSKEQQKCIPDVSFELIPISNLVSNQKYQRRLSSGQISSALEEFDIYQINPVKVSRRDGVNYVFDGQHTCEIIAAASGSRDTPVWCMVFDDLTYTEEAKTFAEQRKHVRNLVPYEIFQAHIEAGSEKQKLIETIVRSYGLKLSNGKTPNGISAINTLEKIYDKYGQEILDRTLKLAIATWEGESNSLSGNMLMGIARLIDAFGDAIQEDAFVENVGKESVKSIIRTARERRGGSSGFAEALLILYNGRKKQKLDVRAIYGGKRIYVDGNGDEDIEGKPRNKKSSKKGVSSNKNNRNDYDGRDDRDSGIDDDEEEIEEEEEKRTYNMSNQKEVVRNNDAGDEEDDSANDESYESEDVEEINDAEVDDKDDQATE